MVYDSSDYRGANQPETGASQRVDQLEPDRDLVEDEIREKDYNDVGSALVRWDDGLGSDVLHTTSILGHAANRVMQVWAPLFALVIVVVVCLLVQIALLWVVILEFTPLKDAASNLRLGFAALFAVADVMIAFVYRDRFARAMAAYEVAPRQLASIFVEIEKLASTYMACLIPTAPATFDPKTRDEAYHVCISDMADHIVAMNTHALLMYVPGEDEELPQYSSYLQSRLQVRGEAKLGHEIVVKTMLREFEDGLKKQQHFGALENAGRIELLGTIRKLRDVVDDFTITSKMRTVPFVPETLDFIMFIYVAFVIPFTMYASVGPWMIPFYPIAVFIVFGTVFLVWYIQGPFSPHSKFRGMAFYEWRAENYLELRQHTRAASERWWLAVRTYVNSMQAMKDHEKRTRTSSRMDAQSGATVPASDMLYPDDVEVSGGYVYHSVSDSFDPKLAFGLAWFDRPTREAIRHEVDLQYFKHVVEPQLRVRTVPKYLRIYGVCNRGRRRRARKNKKANEAYAVEMAIR